MKFTVSANYLLKNIQILNGVVSTNSTLPILDNFLFEVEKNKLTITASDLETTMSTNLDIVSEDTGSYAVPAKMLIEILKSLPEQPLTFDFINNTVEIISESGNYSLAYALGAEFPKAVTLADPSTTIIPAKVLSNAINRTLFAAGNDDLRPVMSGVLFQLSESGITFVATDAHKLVKYDRTDVKSSQEADFIMPKKSLNVLKQVLSGLDDEVMVEYNYSNAKYSINNHVLISRLIEGKYPNYEAVIPKENPNKLLVNRNHFLKSVNCVSIFSNRTTHQICLSLSGKELKVSAEDADYSNKADERLICDYQGDDMQIGFNARFLSEMLKNISCDEVSMEMSAPNRAGIISPADGLEDGETVTMLIMPVMLNNK